MAITAEQLKQVAQISLQSATLPETLNQVRVALPGLRASAVDAWDMRGETPALHLGRRDLFLMASDGHCWSVTSNPDLAQGIVLVEHV